MDPIIRKWMYCLTLVVLMVLYTEIFAADSASNHSPTINLVQTIENAPLFAVSPDGTIILVEDLKRGNPLRLIKVKTGETVHTYKFKTRISNAYFFEDGNALFLFDNDINRSVLDLNTGEQEVIKYGDSRSPYVDESTYPVYKRNLLIRNYENSLGTKDLVLVEFPSYKEFKKVSFATKEREPRPSREEYWENPSNEHDFEISSDRKILAYSFDHTLICRSTEDLSVLMTKEIKPPLKAQSLAPSPNGRYIAVVLANAIFKDKRKEYYIAVFEVKTEHEIARLPLPDSRSFAISPDGRLLAVSVTAQDRKTRDWTMSTDIYELPSCIKLTSLYHNKVKNSRYSFLETSSTTSFTLDGHYLIISGGRNTKIWEIK